MDIQYSSLHPDDKTQLLVKASKSLTLLREDDVKRCFAHTTDIKVFGDIDCLSVHCLVGHQADKSRKFTASSDLRAGIRDTYVINLGLVNQYATRSSDPVGVQGCESFRSGNSGVVTVSSIDALNFSTTRPAASSCQHNFHKTFDVKQLGQTKSSGASYDQHPCDCLCLYCDETGVTKMFVSDQPVGDVVNQAIGKAVCTNVPGHENQIHMDFR